MLLVMRRCFQQNRPKVLFYGGGAKGFAHIGVLKVLEEARKLITSEVLVYGARGFMPPDIMLLKSILFSGYQF
jgi:predicted acylesterase/phospholipase RssA